MTGGRARDVDLAVLVSGFPSLSQTFVLHELLDLEQRGVRLHLFALRHPRQLVRHGSLELLRAVPEYVPDPLVSPCWSAAGKTHAVLLRRSGAGYLRALARIRSAPDYVSPRLDVVPPLARASHLARAGLLAHRIVQLGSPPLYVHFAHRPVTLGRFAAFLAGVPYAFFGHARDIWQTPRAELAAKVRDAELVLTCTAEARAYLEELAPGATPVRLAYHGVALEPVGRARGSGGTPVVLGLGRLVEKKGFASLLRAAALLAERGLEFTVRLGGEGPEWPRLQRLTHELGIAQRVVFLGPLSESDVREEYARADIFALPCQRLTDGDQDGLPNTLLEAMAHALPVVSTTLHGVMEAVVDEDCGLLVPQGDHVALARAIERLLADGERRARLGANARRRVMSRFDRRATLPAVHAALAGAGLVTAAGEAAETPDEQSWAPPGWRRPREPESRGSPRPAR